MSRGHHDPHRIPGAAGLAWRQLRADPWTSVLIAMLVAIVSCLGTAGPRVLSDLNARQLDFVLSDLSVTQRDIRTTEQIEPASAFVEGSILRFDGPDVTWVPMRQGLDRLLDEQPNPLRSVLERGEFYVNVADPIIGPDDPASPIADYTVQFRVDPMLRDLVSLVDGEWPDASLPINDQFVDDSVEATDPVDLPPVEVVMTQEAADGLVWKVGDERGFGPAKVRLSGVYVANDPTDPHWAQSPFGADFGTFFDGDLGTQGKAAAYLASGNPGVLFPGSSREVHTWFTLDASNVTTDDVGLLSAQIGAFTAAKVTLVDPAKAGPDDTVRAFAPRFATEIFDTLGEITSQQRATASILAVISAGPIGVTLAVFALGGTLLLQRRRAALALASARGSSKRQLGGLLAAEAALIGLPSAAGGYAAASLIIMRSPSASVWPGLAVAAAVGLIPAVIIGVSTLTGQGASMRPTRSDLGGGGNGTAGARRRSRARLVIDIGIVAVAALATWQLFARGLTGAVAEASSAVTTDTVTTDAAHGVAVGGTAGVDPLLAATPLLLALAAATLTLRLFPLPMRALVSALHTRRSMTPFIGSARSVRDPAGGLVPALAVIVGVAVIALSTVLYSTISTDAERAAWDASGAPIRLNGPTITDDLTATIQAVPGVDEVARVARQSRTIDVASTDARTSGVSIYVVGDSLEAVHTSAPQISALPSALYADSTAPAIVTGGPDLPQSGVVQVGGFGPGRVVGHAAELPGAPIRRSFVVISQTAWETSGRDMPRANAAFISPVDPEDREAVAAAVARAVPNSFVQTPQQRLDAFTAAPATSGLITFFASAIAVTTVLTVLAILLAQALGGVSRMRLLALLRTMGASRRDISALTAWEVVPVLTVAGVVGAALGMVVPWLLVRAVDLRSLTGSPLQPPVAIDPVMLAGVAALVLSIVAFAVIVVASMAARADLSQHVRLGEER